MVWNILCVEVKYPFHDESDKIKGIFNDSVHKRREYGTIKHDENEIKGYMWQSKTNFGKLSFNENISEIPKLSQIQKSKLKET